MKEITVVTTVEKTEIIRFEDSPDAYEGVINFMDNARKDITDIVTKQFAESDDVNVKVQFFVNDSGDVAADIPIDTSKTRDKCRNCRHRNFCGDHIVVKGLCVPSGFESFAAVDAD